MSLRNLRAWGMTALALVAGVLLSLRSGDWGWFARSGSVVVAIGIVLTSHQIFEHNRRLLAYQRRRHGRVAGGASDHDWADENSMRRLIRARHDEEDHWRREFSGFYMLVGGTLVWGFGDLLGPWLG